MEKKIKVVMFDLDGTLLPMDQDLFVKTYFGLLSKKMSNYGYEPKSFIENVWKGTYMMIKNDGKETNESVFWKCLLSVYGENCLKDLPLFDEFYEKEFLSVRDVCGFSEKSAEIVRYLKSQGFRVVLATNPVFPAVATENRCRWAGLEPDEFEIVTTYENSSYCKPNPLYFSEIISKLGVAPEECLMVGNDFSEDGAAAKIGASVFILTNNLINKNNEDISVFPNGDFNDLRSYIDQL